MEKLTKPVLYERTKEKFWTDPYIAEQMLEAHLNPSHDAASRKPQFISDCADWLVSILPKGSNLLDIGCGPGLYTKEFAKRGLKVTGLDFSENSIAYARKHDPDSKYLVSDYLELAFENQFDAITLIYCDYGALIPEERQNLLGRINKALKPGGLFVLDVFTPKSGTDSQTTTEYPDGGFFSPNPHTCHAATFFYDDLAKATKYTIVEGHNIRTFNLWDCFFTPQTLSDEVATHGFTIKNVYADFTGNPFTKESETICAVLVKNFI
ncbi:MAG: methyltransferase domain-containing protein [Defluviitaleaceae bacterium]|nr:methyltransferase domain-containing protein [Defluviitaleaceae bacterium]